MRELLRAVALVPVGLLFASTIAVAEPYPYLHEGELFVVALALFVCVWFVARGSWRDTWLFFGVATVVCYAIPFAWFWFGAMDRGWWYPPQIPLLQQLHLQVIDGEADYDAEVTNAFLVLWVTIAGLFGARALVPARESVNET